MKTINKILSILIILLIVSSCREITVTTEVHKDGSFTRTITITGDSADVFKPDLPYPIDESWAKTTEVDTTDKEKDVYTLVYSKTFKNSKQLDKVISQDTGWRKQLDRSIEIKKRYGLFYSYLTFMETVPATNPFTVLDYRDYLSEEDLRWLSNKVPVTPADSTYLEELDERAFKYVAASAMEELYQTIIEGVVKLGNPELTIKDIELYKDSIIDKDNDPDYNHSFDAFYEYYARWSNDTTIYLLKELEPPLFSVLNPKLEAFNNVFDMEQYVNEVELPGLITETNSVELQGNRVKWDVDSWSIMFEDREMYIESRVINVWGFILVGIVLLSLLFLIIYKTRTNNKK